jgi:hypothetical protein
MLSQESNCGERPMLIRATSMSSTSDPNSKRVVTSATIPMAQHCSLG